jgi:hypothetical protein
MPSRWRLQIMQLSCGLDCSGSINFGHSHVVLISRAVQLPVTAPLTKASNNSCPISTNKFFHNFSRTATHFSFWFRVTCCTGRAAFGFRTIHRLSGNIWNMQKLPLRSNIQVACLCWKANKTHYIRAKNAQPSPVAQQRDTVVTVT